MLFFLFKSGGSFEPPAINIAPPLFLNIILIFNKTVKICNTERTKKDCLKKKSQIQHKDEHHNFDSTKNLFM